jgi:RNA polymerase sigma-70 factor (ECF subfamily)
MRQMAEQELIGRAVKGDEDAFRALYDRHHPQVHSIISRRVRDGDDTRDLVQTVFVRAFSNLRSFRAEASFSTWLFRIAVNTCNSFARSPWNRRISLEEVQNPESSLYSALRWRGEDALQTICREEDRARVRSRIGSLPEPYRQTMWMRHVLDLSYERIADRLGLPMGTVKTHLHRGLQSLRKGIVHHSDLN